MNTNVHLKLFFPCFMIIYIRVIVSYWTIITPPRHCVKSVQIRGYFWPAFSCIRTRNNSAELADALVSCDTDCYGTLRNKQGLPNQYWEWKPKKGDPPKSQFKGEVGAMRWNDASKTKSVKFVSMLSTIHTFEMVDSNKVDRSTGAVIQKPDVIMDYNVTMGVVDLISRVLIPYSSQRRGVNWYRKIV